MADPVVVSVPVAVAVTEGSDSDAVVTISVDEAFGEEVFFRVTYADVTATGAGEGGDYDDIAVQDVRFGASDTSVDIEVGIRLDELAEEDETFTVTIAPAAPINEMFCRTTGIGCTGLDRDLPAGFVLGNATTTVTISDNQSPVIAEIADVTVGVGEEVDITATATDADGDALTYTWTREESETTPALPDNTALDSERLTFTPTQAGTYTMTVTADDTYSDTHSQSVIITVADPVVVSVPEVVAVTEGSDSDAVVTISVDEAFGEEVFFRVTYADVTATGAGEGGDYDDIAVQDVRFGASDTSVDIEVGIRLDELAEEDETFTVTIAPAAPANEMFCRTTGIGCTGLDRDLPAGFVLGNATTTVTISDNQSPVIAEIADVTVGVGEEVDITATATDADGDALTYTWTREESETTPALPDNTALDVARLRFTPTEAGTYTMTVTADDTYSDTHSQSVIITVADPAVPVAVAVTEGSDSDAVVTISVDEAFGEEVFFRVTYADVTATGAGEGGDYDDIAVQDVRFGASDTSVDIEVGIRLDELAEEDETFTVTIAPAAPINEMFCRTTGIGCTGLDRDLPAGFVLGNATTTVTISDNQSPVIAEIADVTVGVGEEVDITATATDADGDALTYTWTREESETTPALPDNTALDSERLTFTPTQAGTYTMTVTADDTYSDTHSQSVIITVADPVVVSVPEVVAVTEGSDSDAVVTISVDEAFGEEVFFRVTYADVTATGAGEGGDYDDIAVQDVRFGASDTSVDIEVGIRLDELAEEDETFTVTIAPAAPANEMFCRTTGIGCTGLDRDLPAGFVLGNATTTVTISDNQSPVIAEIADVTVGVGEEVDITATATDADGDALTYTWTREESETTPALPDNTALDSERLTFTPTQAGTYTMTVTADDTYSDPHSQTVTITVIRLLGKVSVPETVTVTEGINTDSLITISVGEAFGEEVFFRVTYTDGTATGAGEGGDYNDIAVQDIRFEATDTSVDIPIFTNTDELAEGDETFTVTIAPAAPINEAFCRITGTGCVGLDRDLPAGFVLGNATTTVTIIDNQQPVIAEIDDVTIEIGKEVDITATVTGSGDASITYTWTRQDGETTPALPDNTALNTARLTFTPTQAGIYTMTVTADNGHGNTHSQTVTITVLSEQEIYYLQQFSLYSQQSNEMVSVQQAVSVNETDGRNSYASITVSVTEAFEEVVYFSVTYQDVTATGGSKLQAGRNTQVYDDDYIYDAVTRIAFEPGETSKEIRIPIGDDEVVEGAETFTVTVSPAELTSHSEWLCTLFTCPRFCMIAVPSSASPGNNLAKCTLQTGELPEGFAMGNSTTTVTIYDDDTSSTLDPNRAPVLESIAAKSIRPYQRLRITARAVDPGDSVTYEWSRKSGETSPPLPAGTYLRTAMLDFRPTRTGTYTMTVTATDSGGNIDTETVIITVLPPLEIGVPETLSVTEGVDSAAVVSITTPETYPATTQFDVIFTDGTAIGANSPANRDYDNTPVVNFHGRNFVYFNNGSTSLDITIPITDDAVAEGNETFTVTIRPRGGRFQYADGHQSYTPEGWILGNATTTVTIMDDDNSPVLADLTDVTVKVGEQVDITATATDADVGDTISYVWTRKAGETTPALPGGTTVNTKRLTFTPTATGTYTMTVTASDGNGNTDTKTVVITVAAKTVVSVPTAVAVTEGTDSNATVTISVAEAFEQSVTFNVSYGGTATGAANPANGDYDNDAVTSVTFGTSDTSKNIVIPITDDDLDETAETITVTIAPSSALPTGFSLGNATTTVTITDDDNSPVLADLTDVTVKVGEQVDITATATDADVGDTISYVWTRKAGETTPALPGGTTVNTKRLTFTPTTTGTYTMTVTASDGNGNSDTKTVVIIATEKIVVSVPAAVAVTEGTDSNATVTISVAEAFEQSVTFNVSYGGTATGAANPANGDYDNDAVTSVTFGTSDTSKNIVIPITDDDLDESAETIIVTIAPSSALPAGYTLGNAVATVTVTDDDNSPVLGDLTAVGVKVGQQVDITATATDADVGDTISYAWTRKAGESTPALPGGTTVNTKRLTFTPTATGTYTMTVTASDGNGNTDTKTVVITVAAKVVVSVPTTVAVTEGTDNNATVTISLAEAFGQSVTFNVSYGGTATGANNPANGDYDNDAVTSVTFSTTDTSKNILIPITNDGLDESAETIVVSIAPSAALPAGYTLGNAVATVTITDDDDSPVLEELTDVTLKVGQLVDITANATDGDVGDTISYTWTRKSGETTPALPQGTALNAKQLTFTPTTTGTYTMTVTASDGNGNSDTKTVVITVNPKTVVSVPSTLAVTEGTDNNATVTVSLAEAFGQSVTFSVSYGGTATGAANPANGDYDNDAVTSVTFSTTDTSKNILIPITNDGLDESAETIVVTIAPSAALPAGYTLGNATTTVTITDDDDSPVLEELTNVTLKAGQLVDITANATDGDVGDTISYAWTRKANENLPALPQGTALNAKQLTFTPTTTGVYTMTVTASDGNGNSDAKTVVITVNPKTVVSVPAAVVVTEGNDKNATVTISLAEAFGQSVTFNVSYGGTATGAADPSNGDYDNDAVTSVTFTSTDTLKYILIPITDDEVVEGAETVVVTVAPSAALPAGYRLGNATTTVTITDYDSFPLLVTSKVGQLVDVIATVANGNGDDKTYTYRWTRMAGETAPVLPAGTVLNRARLMFTPAAVGTYTMTVTATDGNGEVVSTETVVVTVVVDTVVSVPDAVSVTEGTDAFAAVRISAGEPLSEDVTFEVISDSAPRGEPATSDMDYDEVGEVVFEAGERFVDVMVPITDDGIDEDNETFLVIIVPVNPLPGGFVMGNTIATVTIADDDSSPVLKPIEDVTVRVGQKVNITASATDEDGDTVTYEWSRKAGEVTPPLPESAALDEAGLVFTPTQVGTYTITVTASDGNGNTDTRTVTIAVVGTLSFGPGEVSKTVTIPIPDDRVDEDVETITVTIEPVSELPAGFRLGNATATITVIDDDSSPVLEPLDNVTAQVGQRIDITATATHADEDETITYAWTREPGETTPPLPEGTTLNTARLRFTTTASGTYTMTVTATDTHGNTDTQAVVITVGTPSTPEETEEHEEISPTDNDTNPLELAPFSDLVLRLGQQVDITAVATHADEDETITYAWTREPGETTPSLPEGTALNTARLTFTPTQTGTYTMTVMATDTKDYAYLRTITITITTDNLITIKPTTTTITEGTNPTTTITITLDKPLQQPVNFNLHYTHHQPDDL
ncbi:PKD domain-containing protein [Candidatus Poriferisocius sp.]|uniref:PKD domain-containing protein n=1 Tax=Candidatus Poriferisocius sp. TaxID=3101276 RepID=UPI003B023C63